MGYDYDVFFPSKAAAKHRCLPAPTDSSSTTVTNPTCVEKTAKLKLASFFNNVRPPVAPCIASCILHVALQIALQIDAVTVTKKPSLLRSREGRARLVRVALAMAAAVVPIPLVRVATVGLPAAARVGLEACRAASVIMPPTIGFIEKQVRKASARAARKRKGKIGGVGNGGEHSICF